MSAGVRFTPPIPALSKIDTGTKNGQLEFATTLEQFLRKVFDGNVAIPGGVTTKKPGQLSANSVSLLGSQSNGWLPGGSTFGILTAAPSNPTGPLPLAGTGGALLRADCTIQQGIVTTKGDILGYSTVPVRVQVGTDGKILTANSTATPGVEYEQGPDLTNQLQAMWRFEATGFLNDWWGGNTLTGNNAPTSVAGLVGNAIHFARASSQSASIVSNAFLQGGATVPYMVAGAFNCDTVGGGFNNTIVSKATGTTGLAAVTEFWIVVTNGGLLEAIMSDGVSTGVSIGPNVITAGVTHYFIWWFDPIKQTLNLKVDDGQTQVLAWTTGMQTAAGNLTVGALGNAPAQFMNGWVDALMIAKRVPTPIELEMLWNGGLGREILVAGHL